MIYETPKLELANVETEDIIRTSDPLNGLGGGDGHENWVPRS